VIRTVGLLTRPPDANGHLDPTSAAIRDALLQGYKVALLEGGADLPEQLHRSPIDLIFNNFSGEGNRRHQAAVCALMDLMEVPYTGSDYRAHIIGLHKDLAKKIFDYHDIKTPTFVIVDNLSQTELARKLSPPLFVKPVAEGSSTGIGPDSVVYDHRQLVTSVRKVLREYNQPALVEQYIDGREFSIGVLGNEPPTALPPVEISFAPTQGFYTHRIKMGDAAQTREATDLDPKLHQEMADLAVSAFRAVGCQDYARVDVRVDSNGAAHILEINTLPGLRPGFSDFPKAAVAAGMSYGEMVHNIVRLCLQRHADPARASS